MRRPAPGVRVHLTLVGLLVLGFLVFMLHAAAPAAAQGDVVVGQVVLQQGAARAIRGDRARDLHVGATVFRGERVVTAPDAKVALELLGHGRLSIGAETEVELTEYLPAAGGTGRRGVLTLFIGILRTTLTDTWAAGFEVRTRAAVAGVRSTDWVTEAEPDTTAVFVVSGAVAVAVAGTAGGEPVVLPPGFGTDVPVGGAPSAPGRWGDARVADVLARTRLP